MIFLSVLFLGIYTFLHFFTRHGKGFILPDLTGLTPEEAREVVSSMDLRLEVTDSLYMPKLPKGVIFRQVPPAGQHVKEVIFSHLQLCRRAANPVLPTRSGRG